VDTFVFTFLLEVLSIAIKQKDLYINEQIRAKEVMVIGPNGEQLGLKGIKDALTLASYAGFDLVLISPTSNPQVCKIMDYNKYKYESKKKNKENMKKQRETNLEMKEYRLSVTIDVADFQTRVRNASKYLEKGHKIKVSVKFRGRELAHSELGKDVLLRFANAVVDIATIDTPPKMEGRYMNMILMPTTKEK
jgi:translation initiation factor IF-3